MPSQAPIQIAPRVLPLNDLILHYQLKRDSMYILVSSVYCYLTLLNRIDVRDQLKHLEKDPREEDQLEVEMLQQALTTDLISLRSIQLTFHQTKLLETYNVEDLHTESFDDQGDEVGEVNASGPDETGELNHIAVPPECIPLHLPSLCKMNKKHPLCQAKLTL